MNAMNFALYFHRCVLVGYREISRRLLQQSSIFPSTTTSSPTRSVIDIPLQRIPAQHIPVQRRPARAVPFALQARSSSKSRAPSKPLRVLRVMEPGQQRACVGRMVISGRMADVCAELDRLAAREAAMS